MLGIPDEDYAIAKERLEYGLITPQCFSRYTPILGGQAPYVGIPIPDPLIPHKWLTIWPDCGTTIVNSIDCNVICNADHPQ
jgi:hypothetical protein